MLWRASQDAGVGGRAGGCLGWRAKRWCLDRLLDEPPQPPWVDGRYGPLGGPWGFNNVFSALFRPFMSLIFYVQVRG